MPHLRVGPLVSLLLLAALRAQDVHVAPAHGFRLARPDAHWTFRESKNAAGDYELTLYLVANAGAVAVAVKVAVASALETADQALRSALEWMHGKKEYADAEQRHERIAGADAPGLSVRYSDSAGRSWRIEQHYLVADGRRYIVQVHAPAADFAAHAAAFHSIRASFALTRVEPAASAARRIEALAARCGTEAGWAEDWSDATARAATQARLILVAVREYPGFALSDDLAIHTFMDPDVLELVQERFVPLRFHKGMMAPFVDAAVYGMGDHTFGQALLVVDGDGRVLAETSAVQPAAAFDFLLEAAARYGKPAPGFEGAGVERAAVLMRRGELAAAAAVLAAIDSAEACLLRAAILRKQRHGEAALAELAQARRAEGGAALAARIDLQEATVLLRLDRRDDARRVLDRLLEQRAGAPEIPAAMYWRGVCDAKLRDQDATRARWDRLLAEYPESRWAAQAAGMLHDTKFKLGAPVDTRWPDAAVLASLRFAEAERLTAARSAAAVRDAEAELLRPQRDDGAWISPSELAGAGANGVNPFVDAITAIAGRSLLAARTEPEVAAALQRALAYLLASQARARDVQPTRLFMDYTVWCDTFALWFYAECVQAGVGDAKALRRAMAERIADLGQRQADGGGFSYYLSNDVGAAPVVATYSASFVTAPVVMAMLRARQAGVDVPDAMLARALACLERLRHEDGLFEYMLADGAERPVRRLAPDGAAGRSPVCELALFEAGRSSETRLRRALELFVTHRTALAGELGKALMHAGAHGQGCHYVLFDYAFAAAAWRALPAGARGPGRSLVLDLVLAARRKGGSFLDTTVNGRAYGTAAALQSLRDLAADSR